MAETRTFTCPRCGHDHSAAWSDQFTRCQGGGSHWDADDHEEVLNCACPLTISQAIALRQANALEGMRDLAAMELALRESDYMPEKLRDLIRREILVLTYPIFAEHESEVPA